LGKGILGRDTKSIRILVVSDIHGSEIGIQDIVKKSQALKPDLVVI
jgi:Icc-related predicted phosphoesterase